MLVFHSDSLFVYTESLALTEPLIPFPLHTLDVLAVYRNFLLSCPSSSVFNVHQLQESKEGKLQPPALVASWKISDHHKISNLCWASCEESIKVFLGTRDGSILRLDSNFPNSIAAVSINGTFPGSLQSATISCFAAAPCNDEIYAVGYASGPIAIYQDKGASEGFKTLHYIATPTKVLALSWHYSAQDKTKQNLAILREGSDRLQIWTVDVTPGSPLPRKIRDIPFPPGHSIPSICTKFVQWSKGGKVTRASNLGLVVADVRAKRVVAQFIAVPPPVVSLVVDSAKGTAWVIDSENGLSAVSLVDGGLLCNTKLPFSVLQESAAILDSPVVFLHRPSQVTEVVYKNKRAIKSPLTPLSGRLDFIPERSELRICSLEREPSSTIYRSSSQPIHLSMVAVKCVINSLFPAVLKSLTRIPTNFLVPEFDPAKSTRAQYLISSLFGSTFNATDCYAGMAFILQQCVVKDPASFKSIVFSFLLNDDIPLSQLASTLQTISVGRKYSDRLVVTLLSIGSLTRNQRDSVITAGILDSAGNERSCSKEMVKLFQDLLGHPDEARPDEVHLVCSYLVSVGYHSEATHIYIIYLYFLEAIIVALLSKTEFAYILANWCKYFQAVSNQNMSMFNYLSDVYTNLMVPQQQSIRRTSGSTLDGPSWIDGIQLATQMSTYSISSVFSSTSPHSGNTQGDMIILHSSVDEVAIFSPALASEKFPAFSTDVHAKQILHKLAGPEVLLPITPAGPGVLSPTRMVNPVIHSPTWVFKLPAAVASSSRRSAKCSRRQS